MSNLRFESEYRESDKISPHLLYISTSKYGGDWHSTLHSHKCAEFFYVLSGQGKFRIEELTFDVGANEIVIVNSHVGHTEFSDPEKPMEYIALGIEGAEFLLEDASDYRYCKLQNCQENKKILYYVREILAEMENRKPHYAIITDSLLELIAYRLLRQQSMSMIEQTGSRSYIECARVKQYIDENYTENITLSSLAERTHMSKYYLVHSFTKAYGMSPISYLTRKKINESKYFLSQTNYSISQIARIIGFSSANYFAQSFKRMESISPSDYRENMRRKEQQSR